MRGSGQGVGLHEVWEHDFVFERLGDPDQIQRVLIYAYLLGEQCRVVRAEEVAAVWVDADPEVAHADFEHRSSDDVGDGRCDAGVDLCGVVCRRVGLVIEGYEEDAGYEG